MMMQETKSLSRNLILFAVIAALVFFLYKIRALFFPLVLSVTLAYAVHPVVLLLERRKVPRWAAILISYIFLFAGLSILTVFLAKPLTKQVSDLGRNWNKKYMKQITKITSQVQEGYLKYQLPEGWNKVISKEMENMAGYVLTALRKSALGTFKLFSHLIELFLVPILAFYMLLDREKIRSALVSVFPPSQREQWQKLISSSSEVIDKYIKAQVLLCTIMGILATVIFTLLELPFALLAGIIAGITKAIPIVGPFLGAIPALALALLNPNPGRLIVWVIIFFSLAHLLENKIVLPKVMERYVNLHPITIILSLLAGGQLAGVLGMFVAVPVAAVVKIFVEEFYLRKLNAQTGAEHST